MPPWATTPSPGWAPPPPGWGTPWGGPPPLGDAWHSGRRSSRPPVPRRFVVLVTLVVLVALGAGIGIGDWIAPTSPVAARRAATQQAAAAFTGALQAARHAGSFHYVERSNSGGQSETIAGNAAAHGGTQLITTGSDQWHLLLVGTAVYFKGNASAMVDQLGAPAAVAQKDAQRWISVPSSTGSLYQGFEVGITASSNLSQFNGSSGVGFTPTAVGSSTSGSTPTMVIHGGLGGATPSTTNQATLVVQASNHLPMSLTGQASGSGQSETLHWTFSHWGEHVPLHAPASPIAYGSLGATPPPSSSGGGSGSSGGGLGGLGSAPTAG